MKDSLILNVSARCLLAFAIPLSLFVLLRGHNEPGGGFIGGLVAAIALGFHAIVRGAAATRRLIRLDPIAIGGIGLLVALGSGLPALLLHGEAFLTHQWLDGLPVGTAIVFDIGVHLVVVGFALGFLLPVLED